MIVSHKDLLDGVKVENPEARGALMKVLITPKEGWEGHVMRIFEVEVDGFTPKHNHPWPHINYIIGGKGILHINGEDNEIKAGSFAYVPSNLDHQFRNIGDEKLEFVCIVPEEGHK
ncbi:MAG: cupin domain-containing protein [Tissierellaceae bacterium]